MVGNSCIVAIFAKAVLIKAKGLGALAMRIITGVRAVSVITSSVMAFHKPVANRGTIDGAVVHFAAGVVDMAVIERGMMFLVGAIPLRCRGAIGLALRLFAVYMERLPMALEAVIILFSVRSHGVCGELNRRHWRSRQSPGTREGC